MSFEKLASLENSECLFKKCHKKVKNLAWRIDESSEDSACLLKLGVSSKTLACLLKQKSKRLNTAKIKKAYFWKIYEKP